MTSDSSDNEDLELLKEAQDTQFLKENLYSQEKDRVSSEVIEKPVSLRITNDENEQFNCLKVTPEFRKFVAKHLTKILDNKLEKELEYDACYREFKKKRKNSGVKLFSHSEKLLKVEKDLDTKVNLCINKTNLKIISKPKFVATQDDLKALAVCGEDILSKKDTKYWSNRSKSKIFSYKKKNGKLQLLETQFK